MTAARFPHSETPGSMPGCRLPGEYRRLQRPSSAPGAKASTVCPYKLGTLHTLQTSVTASQKQEMLASTVQFSKNRRNRSRIPPIRRHTRLAVTEDPDTRPALKQDGRPVSSGPNSVSGSPARVFQARARQPSNQCSTRKHGRPDRHSLPQAPVLLRKEVIQPHLPVRLPCYDFVPIADPTFDGSLPYGLGRRLRVLPTFVT
jgi:hypothetical protein